MISADSTEIQPQNTEFIDSTEIQPQNNEFIDSIEFQPQNTEFSRLQWVLLFSIYLIKLEIDDIV